MRLTSSAAALLLVLLPISASGTTRTWSNTSNGASGSWTNGGLWSPAGVPEPNDDLLITQAGSYSCFTGSDFTIRTLKTGGSSGTKTVEVSSGTSLTIAITSNINQGSILRVNGSVENGEINVNGDMQLANGSLLIGPATLFVNGGGYLRNQGGEIRGRHVEVFNGTFDVSGALTLSGGSTILNDGTMNIGANIIRGSGTAGTILNKDTIKVVAPAVSIGVDITNEGAADLGSGTITFAGSSYLQAAGTTTLKGASLAGPVTISGGTFSGTGSVGSTVNGGTIALASPISVGSLNVQGDFTQQPTGSLKIKIGGANQFDRFQISGLATLGGQLSISFLNGFVPTAGMQFPVITFGTSLGQFAIQNGFQVGDVVMKPVYSGTGVTLVAQLASTACGTDSLCLLDDRFDVTLSARDPRLGTTGPGVPTQQNNVFGYFTIPAITGNTQNPEVIFKMLDGTAVNQKYWVFYGGLTDFEYTLTVFDRVAGTTRTYTKPGGQFVGGADTSAFGKRSAGAPLEPWLGLGALDLLGDRPAMDDPPVASTEAGCVTTSDALCVLSGRFRIRLAATDPRTGATGAGVAIAQNDLYGYFSIPSLTGNPGNVEVAVKMLDGRPVNAKFWLFYGGLTDLEYTLTVTDTTRNVTKSYTKPAREFVGGADTSAF